MPGLRKHYSDISIIGKHFLVKSLKKSGVKRHYTVSNCMQKEVYDDYIRVLNNGGPFNESLINENESRSITMTVKNYKKKDGLS